MESNCYPDRPLRLSAPQTAVQVCKLDFSDRISDENIRRLVFTAELTQGDQLIDHQLAFFAPIKHLQLFDPAITSNLHCEGEKLVVELTSHSPALLVEASLSGADVVFSDNYFSLASGRTIEISCPLPAGWTLSQAQKAFRVRSIYDSYAHIGAD